MYTYETVACTVPEKLRCNFTLKGLKNGQIKKNNKSIEHHVHNITTHCSFVLTNNKYKILTLMSLRKLRHKFSM